MKQGRASAKTALITHSLVLADNETREDAAKNLAIRMVEPIVSKLSVQEPHDAWQRDIRQVIVNLLLIPIVEGWPDLPLIAHHH
jgi:hypothetical protein